MTDVDCVAKVASSITNLTAKEVELVEVMCRHGDRPDVIVKGIRALRWIVVRYQLDKALVDPPMTQEERKRAFVLNEEGWECHAIVADILKGRELRPKTQASKRPKIG